MLEIIEMVLKYMSIVSGMFKKHDVITSSLQKKMWLHVC